MSAPGQSAGQFNYGQSGVRPGQVPTQSGPLDPTTNPTKPPKQRGRRGVSWVFYLVTVVILVVAFFVILFITENHEITDVVWLGTRYQISVERALGFAAAGGFVLGLLVAQFASFRVRRKLRAAKNQPEK
jgi:uncharacterized integral membrane protein